MFCIDVYFCAILFYVFLTPKNVLSEGVHDNRRQFESVDIWQTCGQESDVLFLATHVVVYNCMSELLPCCRIFRGGRYNQINDSVTHVIVDSLTEDVVAQLRAGSLTSRYTTTGAS